MQNLMFLTAMKKGLNPREGVLILHDKRKKVDPRLLRLLISRGRLGWILLERLFVNQSFKLNPIYRRFALARPKFIKYYLTSHEIHVLKLSSCLDRLCNQLILMLKSLYQNNILDIDHLTDSSFKNLMVEFCSVPGIEMIDYFSIMNTFREMDNISFMYDSKKWFISFSDSSKMRVGMSEISITLKRCAIFEIMHWLKDKLAPEQKDLIYIMYNKVLRRVSNYEHLIPQNVIFNLSVETSYQFWRQPWENQRKEILTGCLCSFNCEKGYGEMSNNEFKSYQRLYTDAKLISLQEILSWPHMRGRYGSDRHDWLSFDPRPPLSQPI